MAACSALFAKKIPGMFACRREYTLFNFAVFLKAILFFGFFSLSFYVWAEESIPEDNGQKSAQTILHMLDYVSVDYGGAVILERVLNEGEYKEQLEFAKHATKLVEDLPEHPRRFDLIAQAESLTAKVIAKASASEVHDIAQNLRRDIIVTYNVSIAPRQIPDLVMAESLYQKECVKCHGVNGYGDGPESIKLSPRPADFHDMARMNQRSVYGLYNTITLGVDGTAMKAKTDLSDEQRWSLAFYVSNFRTASETLAQGRKYWEKRTFSGPAPDLAGLSTLTSNEIILNYGEQTRSVYAYLRANPEALVTSRKSTLLFASSQLDMALQHYRQGNILNAQRTAIAAYLEGFEPVEISLDNADKSLRLNIEREMREIRQLLANSDTSVRIIAAKVAQTKLLLNQADELLRDGKLSSPGAFASSLLLLLREGLEGMLVLAAIIAFVIRSGQRQALAYIHAGWIAALILGVFSWIAATWLVDISGASRELTEGITALIASAMLVYIGFWLHDKAHALSWQSYIRNQVNSALEQKTLWALALVSFFAIYREVFEIVLFYQALWSQVNETTRPALWSGMVAAVLLLLTLGWLLFSFGIKLPLGKFFSGASILLATLAVVFVGQGVSALQEASIISTNSVNFVTLPMLGIHPTYQSLLAQVAVIVLLVLLYRLPFRQNISATPN